jgi:hypothetical protein
MSVSLAPPVRFKAFYPATGRPLAGGQLWTLQPGTTGFGNLKASYTDSSGQTVNTNPVILDPSGEADVWLSGYTKLVLQDAQGNQIYSRDNVSSVSAPSGQIANNDPQWTQQPLNYTFVNSGQFSTPGDQTGIFIVGSRIQVVISAGIIEGAITAAVTGGSPLSTVITVVWDSTPLDASMSSVSVGILPPEGPGSALPLHLPQIVTANRLFTVLDLFQEFIIPPTLGSSITLTLPASVAPGSWISIRNRYLGGVYTVQLLNVIDGIPNPYMVNYSPYGKELHWRLFFDGTNWLGSALPVSPPSPSIPRSYLSGLTLSAAGGTGTFGVAAGQAADSTNAAILNLGSAMSKTTAAWAAGTGNGSLDTGAISASAWYAVFLIGQLSGPVATLNAIPTNGGANYAVNDTGYITTGSGDAMYQVLTVSGGIAQTVALIYPGSSGYTSGTAQATNKAGSQPGSGSGLTLNITAVQANGTVSDILITKTTAGSAPAPALPSGYTLSRYIGSMLTDASAHWVAFIQSGDRFDWSSPSTTPDWTGVPTTSNRALETLNVPLGVIVEAIVSAGVNINNQTQFVWLSNPSAPDIAPGSTISNGAITFGMQFPNSANPAPVFQVRVITSTSGQIGVRGTSTSGGGSTIVTIQAIGWVDRRGRDN